jgi:hypothetical protein
MPEYPYVSSISLHHVTTSLSCMCIFEHATEMEEVFENDTLGIQAQISKL